LALIDVLCLSVCPNEAEVAPRASGVFFNALQAPNVFVIVFAYEVEKLVLPALITYFAPLRANREGSLD